MYTEERIISIGQVVQHHSLEQTQVWQAAPGLWMSTVWFMHSAASAAPLLNTNTEIGLSVSSYKPMHVYLREQPREEGREVDSSYLPS